MKPYMHAHVWAQAPTTSGFFLREVCLSLWWTRRRVKMESPPRLDLATIHIAPLWKE